MSCAAEEAGQKRNHQESKEDEEQDLRDSCRSSGNAAKAERAGDDCDYEKYKRPIKHGRSPHIAPFENGALRRWFRKKAAGAAAFFGRF
jgi:hypothetical protein